MQDPSSTRWRPDVFARKWHALAERRRNHLAELYDNGRWKRYFSDEAFRTHMGEAVREVEHWRVMVESGSAPASDDDTAPRPAPRAA